MKEFKPSTSPWLSDKKVLITGCCGTIGEKLIETLLNGTFGIPSRILGIDNNETGLFFLQQKNSQATDLQTALADMRDGSRMSEVMNGIDVVFHTAALKHVELCERAPFDAVQTNIHGVRNIIEAARINNVEKVIFTSSDKAVNPTNVMGTSKLMGERLISAANVQASESRTIFASTRFGNVLGSNGSVLPLFARQIQQGGTVTLTDKRMTRFVMSCQEAAELVIDSGRIAEGGEVFITKMPVLRIEDLADAMIDNLSQGSLEIKEIGVKPGEKLYEELMTEEESVRAYDLENYFVILPAFRDLYSSLEYPYLSKESQTVQRSYISEAETAMSVSEISSYLNNHHLLDEFKGGAQ